MSDEDLAKYIVEFFRLRNSAELDEAFGSMRVSDFDLMHGELALILQHRGKPPNWVG